ncbi:MAG: helix-turn-helix transcriptional regulator [Nannocystis sp.]|uniref:helix-turn-helix transcriptional regulator n=1 Tax=Nannocystis sp. TaxID=1962667 RepID=UPI002421E572|nr:helix-turn-helix transcriptional regulator [Nannocystis sp.]MBK9756248.1 helix-turn-helix transcriptional regulator [Nannocystis sp.]
MLAYRSCRPGPPRTITALLHGPSRSIAGLQLCQAFAVMDRAVSTQDKAARQTRFALEGQQYVVVCLDEAAVDRSVALAQLTPIERGMAAQVAKGLSSQAIAAQRGRSVRTVQNQIAAIFGKLRVGNRAQLVIALLGSA